MSENWSLPSLKDAKQRRRTEVQFIRREFELDETYRELGKHRRYIIHTYGCQANERDSETIAGLLEAMGFTSTQHDEKADIILLNTCTIRENAVNKVYGQIGNLKQLKQRNPELLIGICGCMTQEEVVVNKILETYHQVDLIFGTHNIHRLPELVHQTMFTKERTVEVFSKEGDIIENLPAHRFGNYKAWINIMYGCDKFCTYCIVPFTRGKERSRLMEDILSEVNEVLEDGYQEITLLGQNVNAYGKDLKMDDGFADLLEAVALSGIPRIRFTTSHPWDFSEKMFNVIAKYDNIMPFIHLPLQSGNNDILKLMGRRYTIEEYTEIFMKLKSLIPNCSFSTDIIVGFPNESDEQFNDTLKAMDLFQFDNAYTFIFSAREGTPAAKMEDSISMETKKERLRILNDKARHYAYQNNLAYQDKVVKVLVDGLSKKDKSVYSGYTETQKLVNFTGDNIVEGEIIEVKITEPKSYFLLGKAL